MKNLHMLVWLTQFGLSVAAPLAGFTLLAFWLRQRFDLGNWILLVGIGIGLLGAIDGFRSSIKAMDLMSKSGQKDDPPPVSFNDHQ